MLRKTLPLLCLLALPALAVPPDPIEAAARAEQEQALRQVTSPRAAAALYRLHALADELSDLSLLSTTYAQVIAAPNAHPLTRALAHRLAADVARARGTPAKAAEHGLALGFLNDFYLLGSFSNEGKSGCAQDHGPEAGNISLGTPVRSQDRQLAWRKLPVVPTDGYVDLGVVLRPQTEAVGYALTFLEAASDTEAELLVGASGGHRLWVNGTQVSASDRYNRAHPDQAAARVWLKRGVHRVLLKVCQESGGYGFYLRATGKGIKSTLPSEVPPLDQSPVRFTALPTLGQAVAHELSRQPKDAKLRADLATILHYGRAFEDREHTATAEIDRAVSERPKDVALRLLAAKLHDDDHNLRRRALEAALALAPTSPQVLYRLARYEQDRDHAQRALALLQAALKASPRFPAAKLALAKAHEQLGDWTTWAEQVEQAHAAHPKHPAIAREAARVSRRLQRPQEALERLRKVLALRPDDRGTRHLLSGMLADLAQVDEAVRELKALSSQDPFDNGARLRAAELLTANGRVEEGVKLFAEARALAADDAELYEREGRALLHSGSREQAIARFDASLKLRPQNAALKEAVRSLKGDLAGLSMGEPLELPPLFAEASRLSEQDAVVLVDSTFIRVQHSGQSSRFHQLAVRVNGQRGVESYRQYAINYAPARQEVRILKARITKPDGAVADSYGESDRAINEPWSGMYYDARNKVLSFPALAEGDLLELQYRLDDTAQDNLLSDYWGDVDSIQGIQPKLRYQYVVEMPPGRPLYWNKRRAAASVTASEAKLPDGRTVYRFTASNVPKLVPEPLMPGWAEVARTLHVSTYKSWEDVGRYYWGLVRDQLAPNDELKRTVDQVLTSVDRTDELAVVRAIYGFVVSNTRYVALEFGIHGFKPYRVDRVLARRFGDCKDKASLIHAMLKVAGVDSRLVLLRMRHLGDIGDEPASLAAFNHAIIYVPKHALYLDGTAEFHGSRELPVSDRAANVLIIEPEKSSVFVTTPESSPEDNAIDLAVKVNLRADGSASLTGTTKVVGVSAPTYRRTYQPQATRKSSFEEEWAQIFPGAQVKKVTLGDPTKLEQEVALSYEMAVPRYAEALPNGLRFFPFASGRSYTQTYASLAERAFDLELQYPWTNRLSLEHLLPPGYQVGELPPDFSEQTPFGRVKLSVRAEGDRVVTSGEVTFTASRVRAADYPAFRAFLGRIDQAFSRKVTVVKTGSQTAAYSSGMVNSTRRFFSRPAGDMFGKAGRDGP